MFDTLDILVEENSRWSLTVSPVKLGWAGVLLFDGEIVWEDRLDTANEVRLAAEEYLDDLGPKLIALAEYLDEEPDYIEQSDDDTFACCGKTYLVLSEDEFEARKLVEATRWVEENVLPSIPDNFVCYFDVSEAAESMTADMYPSYDIHRDYYIVEE